MQNTVFISYRRKSSKHFARAIYQDLQLNGWDAFFDVESIPAGNFEHYIRKNIGARAHFLLLISPDSLKRCSNVDDMVRREIALAIELERNVVPIYEEEADLLKEISYLPDKLRNSIASKNALRITHDFFQEGLERLRTRYLRTSEEIEIIDSSDTDFEDQPDGDLLVNQIMADDSDVLQSMSNLRLLGQRYLLIKSLATNLYTEIYKAYDVDTRRYVQVAYAREWFVGSGDYSKYQRIFARNIRTIQSISHPAIIPILDFAINEYLAFYIYPDYQDGSLEAILRTRKHNRDHLSKDELTMILRQIGSGLGAIHKQGLLHMQLSPKSIISVKNGSSFIIRDFFTPMEIYDRITARKWYLPPEYLYNHYTQFGDQYSLGMIIIELSTFADAISISSAILNNSLDDLLDSSFISKNSRNILKKAVSINITDRWDSILTFVETFIASL